MKSLQGHSTPLLGWRRSAGSPPDFELLGAEGAYATLTFLDPERLLARIRTAEGTWTLKHLGILNPVVTLREVGGTVNLATFHPHALRNGKLTFQDGATFDWAWLHEGGPGGAFLDHEGRPLVRLYAHTGRDLTSGADFEACGVDLSPVGADHYRQALLACFGWYLLLFDHQKERDAVAAETSLRL